VFVCSHGRLFLLSPYARLLESAERDVCSSENAVELVPLLEHPLSKNFPCEFFPPASLLASTIVSDVQQQQITLPLLPLLPAAQPEDSSKLVSTTEQDETLDGYFSYSPSGKKFKKELEEQLLGTKFEGKKIHWQDGQIMAGLEWETEIVHRLNHSHVILLFVNAEYLASYTSNELEMKVAMERHQLKQARVIPLIIGSCSWKDHDLRKLQYLPRDGKSLDLLTAPRRGAAFQEIVQEMKKSINVLRL
jgi:hypothetical protein